MALLLKIVCVALLAFWLISLPTVAIAQRSNPPQRILILYWDGKDAPVNVKFEENFKKAFSAAQPGTLEYYSEYLETNRFPGENQSNLFRDYLRQKYKDLKPDVIVALSSTSLNFLLKNRAELFPDTPIVFHTYHPPDLTTQQIGAGITGVVSDGAYAKTLEAALKLNPDTERVFVVVGTAEKDPIYQNEVRNSLKSFESRVSLDYLIDLPLDELLAKIKSLPPKSVLLYIRYSLDDHGKKLDPDAALTLIAHTANVPVYSTTSNSAIGLGSVGGYGVDFDAAAVAISRMALDIANGADARQIPVLVIPTQATFDWRQLHRWSLSEANLPLAAAVAFRDLTFWQHYRWTVIGVSAIFLVETLLIALLLVERKRRWEASNRLAASEARYRNVVENQTELICRYLPDSTLTFVNDAYCRYFGRSQKELVGTKFIELIPEHAREQAMKDITELVRGSRENTHDHEVLLPDGRVGWQQWVNRVLPKTSSNGIELQGIGRDISERKHAEEALRESEERNRAILSAIPDLIFVQTREGVYIDYSAKDPGKLLLPPEQFLFRNMKDVLPTEMVQDFRRCFDDAFDTGETQILEYEVDVGDKPKRFEARVARCNGSKVLTVVRDITERKLAEEALSESEEFNRRIVESSSDCIKILDLDGKLLYMSPRGRKLLEISDLGVFMNNSWIEMWPKESQELATLAVKRARMGGAGSFQSFAPTMAGKPRWWDNVVTPIRGASGKIERLLAVSRDITAQKQAVEAVRESESRFAKAFKANPQPMSLTTLEDGRYLDVNESFLSMSGYSYEEVIGRTSIELNIWPKLWQRQQMVESLKTGTAYRNRETNFRTKGGRLRVLLSSAELLEIGGQKCILLSSSDITERKSLEEELRLSEREFSTLVQNSPDVISRLDRHLHYIYISPTAERNTGLSPDTFIGRRPSDVALAGYDAKNFEACCERAFETGKTVSHDYVYAGRNYWTRIIPEFTPEGTVESVMTISEDVTQRLRQEKELLELTVRLFNLQDEERRRIARELHDGTAQNLFAISINLAKLAQLENKLEMRQLIDECQALGDQSLREIRTLSYLLHPPLLDQAGLVSALQWYVEGFSKRSGIYVNITAQPIGRLPSEVETALFRIVQEALSNVRRHSGSETASIRLECKSDEVVLEIKDTGRGLRTQNLFNNADEFHELGVGIPGMRQRLRLLGGRLEITSNGGGTSVAAFVPLNDGAAYGASTVS